jgi:serine/threonine protein kinase
MSLFRNSSRGTGVSILDHYEVSCRIGENSCGSGGEILRCKRCCDGKEFAVKKIAKRASMEGKSQIILWQKLEHRNIVKMHDWFEDIDHLFIVMELAEGGDMYDKIIRTGKMAEKDAVNAFSQVLCAVYHMHRRNIMHCDIKPENLLCTDNDVVKLCDFGFAQEIDHSSQLKHQGTLTYSSPEVIDGKPYDAKADMWSLGVLLYSMLAGFSPFGQRGSQLKLMANIRQCKLNFEYEAFREVSEEAIDLIRKLLVTAPSQRLSAAEALKHPWIANNFIFQGDDDEVDELAENFKALQSNVDADA